MKIWDHVFTINSRRSEILLKLFPRKLYSLFDRIEGNHSFQQLCGALFEVESYTWFCGFPHFKCSWQKDKTWTEFFQQFKKIIKYLWKHSDMKMSQNFFFIFKIKKEKMIWNVCFFIDTLLNIEYEKISNLFCNFDVGPFLPTVLWFFILNLMAQIVEGNI